MAEALLNLRLAAEWSVLPHLDEKDRRQLKRSLPINQLLNDLTARRLEPK